MLTVLNVLYLNLQFMKNVSVKYYPNTQLRNYVRLLDTAGMPEMEILQLDAKENGIECGKLRSEDTSLRIIEKEDTSQMLVQC